MRGWTSQPSARVILLTGSNLARLQPEGLSVARLCCSSCLLAICFGLIVHLLDQKEGSVWAGSHQACPHHIRWPETRAQPLGGTHNPFAEGREWVGGG